jgi:multiple sugar transport system ATP-binding protein
MNFIPARVENGSGALRLNLPNGIVLPVPADRTGRYGGVAGKEVLFGIRPEHLTEPKNLDRPNIATFELTPEVIEPMGMETLVHLWLQGAEICSRIDPTTPAEPGRPLQVAADLNHMHLIDPQTGRVL